MSLYQKITDDMKEALKRGDSERLSVIRMVVAAVKMLEIEKNLKEVPDADIQSIIQRQIKQHRDSIEQFKNGNRSDLAEKEERELKILESYMPEQLKEEDLLALIKDIVTETGLKNRSDSGKVMKAVMEKVRGKADGKVVSRLVMGLLK